MHVWVSYVRSAIYTKPSGSFFKVCRLSFCPFLSSPRCHTPPLSGRHLSLGTTISGFYSSHSPPSLLLGVFFSRIPSRSHYRDIPTEGWGKYNSKGFASRGKITMLLMSVQMSLQHRSCHLLTIRLISWGANTLQAFPLCSNVSNNTNCKQTVCQLFHSGSKSTGHLGELWSDANKHRDQPEVF